MERRTAGLQDAVDGGASLSLETLELTAPTERALGAF